MIHATVVTRRADRRIMGRPGERRNLCGAAPTLHDLTVAEVRRCLRHTEWAPRVCLECARLVTGVRP